MMEHERGGGGCPVDRIATKAKEKQREHFPLSGIGGARGSVRGWRTCRTGLDRCSRIAHIIPPRAVYTPSSSS